jgi:hypothetical protein
MKFKYVIKDTETNKLRLWSIRQVLFEINRDRSDDWIPYNKKDWKEGWNFWIRDDVYNTIEMLGKVRVS